VVADTLGPRGERPPHWRDANHLGESVTTLERAAFGDRPDLVVTATPGLPVERWLTAVVVGAQGHYARAAALLTPLLRRGDDLAALAAATFASHRRQLGGHAAARRLDALGLATAESDDARADVLLGLAADAVGAGRSGEARRLRDRAPAGTWRSRVRAGWVSAEIELGAGRAGRAVPHAEQALDVATASGAVRHRIKSEIVLGAALSAADPAMARKLVTRARDDATDLHLPTLVWPASLLLAQVDPSESTGHHQRAARTLHGLLRSADPRGRELAERSPWVPLPAGPTG
jgi:hypothetical protein